jgi:hypothetical protein
VKDLQGDSLPETKQDKFLSEDQTGLRILARMIAQDILKAGSSAIRDENKSENEHLEDNSVC